MSEQTIVVIAILAFAVIALTALGARSFIQLVEAILSHGSSVEALTRELQQARTALSQETDTNTSSRNPRGTPTTPETPTSTSKAP